MRRPGSTLRLALTVLVPGVFLAFATSAFAQATDGWRQYQGGAAHTGALASAPAPPYVESWQAAATLGGPRGAYGLSAPIVTGGLAIAVGADEVIAVDAATGVPAWTLPRELGPSVPPAVAATTAGEVLVFTQGWGLGPPETRQAAPPSPGSEPTIPEDAGSSLVGVTIEDQEAAWTIDLPAVSRSGVTVDGGMAFVGSNDGTLTAVDAAAGDVVWTAATGGLLLSAPAVGDGHVIASVQGSAERPAIVVAYDAATGDERWRYEPATALDAGTPSVDLARRTVYVAFGDATVAAVALDDGAVVWTRRTAGPTLPAPPAIAGDILIVVDALRGHVQALDPETGGTRWDHALNVPVFRTTPIVVEDAVLVADVGGEVVALDPDTGELRFRMSVADGALRGLAADAGVIVAVRAGASAGMSGLVHDPDGTLVREASPTTLDAVAMVSGWLLGSVSLAVVLFLLGRLAWARLGPPALPEEGESDEDDPENEEADA